MVPVYSLPYLYFGLGARQWVAQVNRHPSEVAFDWGRYLGSTAIGSPHQGLADARAEECSGSRPSADALYGELEKAADASDAQGGWHLTVIPGDADVNRAGPVTATADVPAMVRVTLWNVKVTDAHTGVLISHDGQIRAKHQWVVHLRRTWTYPVWQVCGITTDQPLLGPSN
ncbi:hypothetical protein [Cryptosporangium sp. NPDC051539]|uniref:hypothetical protein n=1 Tax=Cryptosporangium sp. NPDC051539 TaxID=3363962 RepID=UPI0037A2CEF9